MTIRADEDAITQRMRAEWDRRILNDYRFWMSDGVKDDAEMWATGRRDLDILLDGLDTDAFQRQRALDLGCGVGRLIRSAADLFAEVVGVDISEKAIGEASRLLSGLGNVSLQVVNGKDLSQFKDGEFDFCYSFAALGSMPLPVFGSYLSEISRLLKIGGRSRIQIYLGNPVDTYVEDTLAIRSFDPDRFSEAIKALGMEIESITELVLPFEVSDKNAGIFATVVSLRKLSIPSTAVEVAKILQPDGEPLAGGKWRGSSTEYAMAIARAEQHMNSGDVESAKRALEYAVENFLDPDPGILELLDQLRRNSFPEVQRSSFTMTQSAGQSWITNSAILTRRFPSLQARLTAPRSDIRVENASAPILIVGGTPLDNREQPRRAAEVWAEQTLASVRVREAQELVVVGYAGGYHVEALLERTSKPIHVYEPNPAVLRASLEARDQATVLERISSLSVTLDSVQKYFDVKGGGNGIELIIHPVTLAVCRPQVDELKRRYWSVKGFNELQPRIGVVSPIYGGSLPIARFVSDTLVNLKQRTHTFDLGSFYKTYLDLEGFVKDKTRVNALQGYYVEMLSQIVIESIQERPIDILIALAQAPLSPRVLTECRNRGIITAMWFVEDCGRFKTWKEISKYYDYMFIIQRGEYEKAVEAAGAGRAIYLPLAAHPSIHRPFEVPSDERDRWGSKISFVGAGFNNRQQMFAGLAGTDFKIWGTEWPTVPPFDDLVQEKGRRIAPEEYIKIFNSSDINLNLHSSMERDGVEPYGDFVNPRTFELAGCEAFQLTDNRSLLPEMFEVGKEIITFSDRREMCDKIDYYLAHPEERKVVAQRARERVLSEHTYEHRLRTMLGCIYADRYEELKARALASPWTKTLKAAERYPELKEKLEVVRNKGEDPKLTNIIAEIQKGKGNLRETEMKLLFLWHVRQQIALIKGTREGNA